MTVIIFLSYALLSTSICLEKSICFTFCIYPLYISSMALSSALSHAGLDNN